MNNVKDSIGWADYTWNPVTGCRRGCPYCYAKRIHDRFEKENVSFKYIEFHPDRLLDKFPKNPSKIFVGSMSDIEYWEPQYTQKIILVCQRNYKHTFMFLTKSSASYCGIVFPKNVMLGLTLTKCTNELERTNLDFHTRQGMEKLFLSIEPILGEFKEKINKNIELVIVGAMTGPGAIKPKPEWIQSIKDNVPAEKIYWKKNISKYLK